MYKYTKFIFFLFLMVIASCSSDGDCNECLTPPNRFVFNLLDKASSKDVFVLEKYETKDIEIMDVITDTKIIDFDVTSDDASSKTFIEIHTIGWETEKVNYLIKIGDTVVCNLVVDAVRKSENCCSFTSYNEISIENAEYEPDTYTGFYTVYME